MRILGIDPGTSELGISIFTLDNKLNIIEIKTFTIYANPMKQLNKFNKHLDYRVAYIKQELEKTLVEYEIGGFTIETPFINPRRPTSVIPLANLLGILINTALSYNPYMLIYRRSPSEVKNAVNAKGNADKEPVKFAVGKIDELNNKIKIDEISEHEIDAIAVTYSLLQRIRSCYIVTEAGV